MQKTSPASPSRKHAGMDGCLKVERPVSAHHSCRRTGTRQPWLLHGALTPFCLQERRMGSSESPGQARKSGSKLRFCARRGSLHET